MNHRLPEWALKVLVAVTPGRSRDYLVGDFAERFAWVAAESGRGAAIRWFLVQFVRSLPSFFVHSSVLGGSMFSSYLTVAFRSIGKRRFYAGLNIVGLAIGLAIALLIAQFVRYELSYDTQHPDADRLYRVEMSSTLGTGDPEWSSNVYSALRDVLTTESPGVEKAARIHPAYGTAQFRITDGSSFDEQQAAFVDPEWFQLVDRAPVHGDPVQALASPDQVVFTRSLAMEVFGRTDVLGESVEARSWLVGDYTVGAVIEDPLPTSHVRVRLYMPMERLLTDPGSAYIQNETTGWDWTNFLLYLRMAPGADVGAAEASLLAGAMRINGSEFERLGERISFAFKPVTDIHLFSTTSSSYESAGAYRTVVFVGILGLMVLFIACVNFVNLSTARASERAREVCVRKATGARRGQIVSQFLVEAGVMNALALLLGLGLAVWATPLLNTMAGIEVLPGDWVRWDIALTMLGLFLFGTIGASMYPAWLVSAFQPAVVLKGSASTGGGSYWFRQALVVAQFSLSIAMVSGVLLVQKQISHLLAKDPGFDAEQVVVVQPPAFLDGDVNRGELHRAFLERLQSSARIEAASRSTNVPGTGWNMTTSSRPLTWNPEDAMETKATYVGPGFLSTYGMTLIAGREFSSDFPSEIDEGVLINRYTVDAFGFETPDAALGQVLNLGGDDWYLRVIGVFEDVDWISAKQPRQINYLLGTTGGGYISARFQSGQTRDALDAMQTIFADVYQGNQMSYFFNDARFAERLEEETRLRRMVGVFSLFALFVAALGLVGLAALTAAQRRREISIRKVLGASGASIARLMTSKFSFLAVLSMIIATPPTWYAASRWLNAFPDRVSISPDLFLLPALIVLCVSLLASAYHVVKVVRDNPVNGLRSD